MKNIQLINPNQALEVLKQYSSSFIQVITNDKTIVLANAHSFNADQVKGLQIEINMGSHYQIDLVNYPDDVNFELRGIKNSELLLINNTEYLLKCQSLSDLSPLAGLTNLSTLALRDCNSLSDLSPLAGLTNLSTLNFY